jgi:hypothetical protein
MPNNPQFPLVHMNGTSADELIEQQCDIARALRDALEVMAANGPNARDYYPLEAGAWERAREQHTARLSAINAVLADVERMAEYLAAGPHNQLEMRNAQ